MSFSTGTNYCDKCGKPLGIFKQGLCAECEKAEQEPCDDVVSRQAVKEVFPKWKFISYEAYLCAVAEIDKLPPVRPQEPKTGHWITTRTFMHDGEYYCDKCKCDAPNNEKWDYCPNCGCRMVEPQESEEA
jgi:predicted amidophosphoribosyltransferase